MATVAPSTPSKSTTSPTGQPPAAHAATPSRLEVLKAQLAVVDDLLLAGFRHAQPLTPTQDSKEPLSLQATSNNFRRFVQKSGPIFVAQDAAEALLKWEDPPTTLFFAAAWGLICTSRTWFVCMCNRVLKSPAPAPPPAEGSIDYLANLQNIQIMMGRVSAGSDFAMTHIVPLLTWHDTRTSLVLLQLATLSLFAILLAAPYVPIRIVLLLAGETIFFVGHPIVLGIMTQTTPYLSPLLLRAFTKIDRLIEEDSLDDAELDAEELRLVEKLEIEAWRDSTWVPETEVGGELPRLEKDRSRAGSIGIDGGCWYWSRGLGGQEWKVDWSYCGGDLDQAGFVYLHLDGTISSSPFVPDSNPRIVAPMRRRRLVRRAVRFGSGSSGRDVD
ncbi:BZ3500_MvSof-1268-A1-R1_Chr7-3g09706 [Microbotryum saponariae]|uniref:BZ3500_MvSof-1268-A1-R1_Chr7-3g09706 protein n=1 Tax=Microbotryum saponariae TaxID=289078 RepID=A0A2X0LA21_9BASI|nr:BZ3501_MvSof-1269-A2-R1_Chr7-2g09429 [Microbotryum saponariae]SDA02449.1 BZ3500_MvSof-1268-A1-R1_Chr7-3g09706 [Microbotryum saponariae]